jgi:hypothetical protein
MIENSNKYFYHSTLSESTSVTTSLKANFTINLKSDNEIM